jgi:hypothetical protein
MTCVRSQSSRLIISLTICEALRYLFVDVDGGVDVLTLCDSLALGGTSVDGTVAS